MLCRAHASAQKGPSLWDRINPFSDHNVKEWAAQTGIDQYAGTPSTFTEDEKLLIQFLGSGGGAVPGRIPVSAGSVLTVDSTKSMAQLMRASGYSPTQSLAKMDIAKVNQYASLMRSGKWDWSQSKIIVANNNALMSGHHRVVASQMAGVRIPESAIYRMSGAVERTVHSW